MNPTKQFFSRRERPCARRDARNRLGRRSFAGSEGLWIRKPEFKRAAERLPMSTGAFA
jgi:hypothetical protein